jgi:hypothetical protein
VIAEVRLECLCGDDNVCFLLAKRLKREKAVVTNSPRRGKGQKQKNNGSGECGWFSLLY